MNESFAKLILECASYTDDNGYKVTITNHIGETDEGPYIAFKFQCHEKKEFSETYTLSHSAIDMLIPVLKRFIKETEV